MSLPKFSIQQPVFVNLFMAIIILAGLFTFISMPKGEWPDIPMNTISVITSYPGASPEEIEELITKPIEDEIVDIDDIDNLISFTSEGRSVINVNFTMEGDDIYRKLQEVHAEVNKVTDLPDNADNPEVKQLKVPFQVITIGLVGEGVERELNEIAEEMQYDLKKIYGVGDIKLLGNRKREIWVEVDPGRLESYSLSLYDVIWALKGKNLNLPGGTVKHSQNEFILRTIGEIKTVREIQNIIIKESRQGGHVYIREVASVSETFEDPKLISRINGKRGLHIKVSQGDGGNMVDIVKEIKDVAMKYQSMLPDGAAILFANDDSVYLGKRLGILYSNGFTGFILVVITLFLFIGARPALMTSFGIPVAFCGCILLMDIFNISINSLSLFAMIIVLGMIVDDAIVVTENTYRYIEEGIPIKKAAICGAQEVFWPIVAAVGTTMAAFLPMLLMKGALGEFMSIVPKVVVFSLAASIWEAFLVLPSHIAEFEKPLVKKKLRGTNSIWFKKFQKTYVTLLRKVLKARYWSLLISVAIMALVIIIAVGTLDFVLLPNPDFDKLLIEFEGEESTKIERTATLAADAEKFLFELPPGEVLSVKTTIGRNEGSTEFVEFNSNIAEIEVRLTDYLERSRSGHEIMESIRKKLDTLENPELYKVKVLREGPPVGRPVAIRVMGDDFQILKSISDKVIKLLRNIRGVTDIENDFNLGKEEIRVLIDEEKAALFDLHVGTIAQAVQCGYMGGVATEFKDRNDEIDVVVKFDKKTRGNIQSVLDMKVQNTKGDIIPLKNVASLEHASGYAKIRRVDQKRVINILADIKEGENNTRDVIHEVQRRIENYMKQFPGYTLEFGGEYEDTQESIVSMLKAFGLALLLIYMILATTFKSFTQPFMLMISIPFAVIGVFVGLLVMRTPIGMMSFLGMIALAGIVVNDSIVLIDFINRYRAEAGASDMMEAVIEACKTRLRPILLTSITTIFGLMPIALGIFGREFLMTPMAISIVWGLTLSSIMTLFIMPCLYMTLEDIKIKSVKRMV